jgi:hypothetical protein
MKVVVLGVLILVVALAGYFLAPSFGMDGLSWTFGAILSGVVVGAVSMAMSGASGAVSSPSSSPRRAASAASSGQSTTLYVGNLAFKANRHALAKLFEQYGDVLSARIATDRNTRKPRGFGFVEMSTADAEKAMSSLDGETFFGRKLTVTEAKEQRPAG